MNPPATVLYLNHTAQVSGGERALLGLLGGLPRSVRAVLACPEGPLAHAARELGVVVHLVPGTDVSLRLGPLRTPRGMLELLRAAWAVRQVAARVGADLVHANSIRAGIVAVLASRLGGPPAVVHLHDALPPGRTSDMTLELIARGARGALANSDYTAQTLYRARARLPTRVVHNPVDVVKFAEGPSRDEARRRLGLEPGGSVLAVVAQITPWKGQDHAIRVLDAVQRRLPGTRLLLVGSAKFVTRGTRHDNRRYLGELHDLVDRLGLGDLVAFLGEQEDMPSVMRAADLLLVPSWEEPFGMVIIEAMAAGVPTLATSVGGPAEIIRTGEGRVLEPGDPGRWATQVESMLAEPADPKRLSDRARDFRVERYVERVLGAYRGLGAPV